MLVELVVENFAVVERARVRFHAGLNLLTGETGSGKSIVVDALGLLFGGRASADMVRSGADRARLSGIFELPASLDLQRILDSAGIETEEQELLIEREISSEGKSRAFAGSRPITAALLREIAPFLGDIHGQHDQQMLFSADAQLEILDTFAGSALLITEVADLFERWRKTSREAEELERGESEKLRLLDLWNFQRKEIEAADPKPGEDAALEQERRVLQNFARIEENANAAYTAMYDSPESALTLLRQAIRKLDDLCRIDTSLEPVRDALRPVEFAVEEASFSLRDYLGRLEANPGRLEEVEGRLETLDKLKRKYGASLEQVMAFLNEVRARIEAVETAGERKAGLRRELEALSAAYVQAAERLSAWRTEAARKLEKRVEEELASLAMDRTRFVVQVDAGPWSKRGSDSVRFLISPNVGEEPRPLDKIASGGEISRVALALKTCTAGAGSKPSQAAGVARTLVFDEVDSGIGGRASETVGRRLKRLSSANQVLCVTHLPQIAGFADHHFVVEKKESNGRTAAVIQEVEGENRTREIARMVSGERLTREALKHAEQLMKLGSE
jgi:DNA repair protein RecN (Recombination protein N)